jgi:hypothetical protein
MFLLLTFLVTYSANSSDLVYSPACRLELLPKKYIIKTDNFITNFTIEKTENLKKFEITGLSKYLGPLDSVQLKNVILWFVFVF